MVLNRFVNKLLLKIPQVKGIVKEKKQIQFEYQAVVEELQVKENKRKDFITFLYQKILQRTPEEVEIKQWLKTDYNNQELLNLFLDSEEYQELNKTKILLDNLANIPGVITKNETIDTYIAYPGSDRMQLNFALNGKPFQLDDLLECLHFLSAKALISSEKNCFLDIGANIGSTSIYAIKSKYFTQAICFEPSQLNYQFLLWNSQLNGLQNKIQCLKYGIADTIGTQELICSPTNCGDFRLNIATNHATNNNLFAEENFTSEQVDFTTLDSLLADKVISIENIGVIWIDCQGSEGLVFAGGNNFFRQLSVPIYTEFWPYGLKRINCQDQYFDFLKQYGKAFVRFVNNQPQYIDLQYLTNFYDQNIGTGEHCDILILPR
ncbi:methyltransferase, FkbM family [Xenococcus sp. PCC 7305]|uniref:FkbM family methyltransferase n=1 Tax=Xenococcus sp. PCC 7305 TaxID=102125 RepID=UPI0002ABD23E|nr:FkbM family methyltransferase [Xenococcus sp. PCC 7305]ELS04773.1 methyltransferase, FkbM family [Xenococcus sp. PCC 7305]